jgi:hypothetical protein
MPSANNEFCSKWLVEEPQHLLQKSENIKGIQKEDGIKPKFEGIWLAYKWLILIVILTVWVALESMKMVLNSTKILMYEILIINLLWILQFIYNITSKGEKGSLLRLRGEWIGVDKGSRKEGVPICHRKWKVGAA